MADITVGSNEYNDVNIGGKTIAQIRSEFAAIFGIESGATAFVNGDEKDEDYVVLADDEVEFVKSSGKKGSVHTMKIRRETTNSKGLVAKAIGWFQKIW